MGPVDILLERLVCMIGGPSLALRMTYFVLRIDILCAQDDILCAHKGRG